MKPVIDLSKEYGIVLDGGGARGSYQIGAWKALREAGLKICAVTGTSVGALNGAFICMDKIKEAEDVWSGITFSDVMDVEDDFMDRLFKKEILPRELLDAAKELISERGVDITPLKQMIHTYIDEKKMRESGIFFGLQTFSLSDFEGKALTLDDIPEGYLEEYLLASAYLVGFKNEQIQGKTYLDGGFVNNVPVTMLVEHGVENIIEIRIHGPGREKKVKLPQESKMYSINPRVKLGSIIEFSEKRSRQNMKIGYYDAQRMLYGLTGNIYYIEESHEECYYEVKIKGLTDIEKAELIFVLKLSPTIEEKDLYYAILEAGAKLMRIQKYCIYKTDELEDELLRRLDELEDEDEMPCFIRAFMKLREVTENNFMTKSKVLNLLRNSEDYISGQKLCEELYVSRTAVWKVIEQLKQDGYEIEAVRNKGYLLKEIPDILSQAEIESQIKTNWAGREVCYVPQIDSTNIRAKILGDEGAPEGTLVVSDEQLKGRGRRGRDWSSPAGSSIYMTLLLRPDCHPSKAPGLTLVMALSIAQAVEKITGEKVGIKWPNDIVMNGKKVCGILTEMSMEADYIQYVVIGAGINVNTDEFPKELEGLATSLSLETGRQYLRSEIIASVMEHFEENVKKYFETEDMTNLKEDYEALLLNKDSEVRVLSPGHEYLAKALGINEKGELLVQKEDGTMEEVYAGEVSVRGVYNYV